MNALFVNLILCSALLAYASTNDGSHHGTYLVGAQPPVTHIKEVYKAVGASKLKLDVFYTDQSFEKKDNTAIVFFHGGGWAFGSPSEIFTTCERYARMGNVTFSVE